MTLETWLKEAKKQIDALDAELIFLACVRDVLPTGTDRSWLVAHGEVEVSEARRVILDSMVERRMKGEPLAYILGTKEFYGRTFRVTPDVLIPRPETENLVELVKGLDLPKRAKILEVGTGCGCIAITLALELPQTAVIATDISRKALDLALLNDMMLEGRVDFIQSDLLEEMPLFPGPERHFDVIVANLPYVDPKWKWLDRKSLAFEPSEALFVRTEHGLALYRKLFRQLRIRQITDGWTMDYVVVEADPVQHGELVKIADLAGFGLVKTDGYGLLLEA